MRCGAPQVTLTPGGDSEELVIAESRGKSTAVQRMMGMGGESATRWNLVCMERGRLLTEFLFLRDVALGQVGHILNVVAHGDVEFLSRCGSRFFAPFRRKIGREFVRVRARARVCVCVCERESQRQHMDQQRPSFLENSPTALLIVVLLQNIRSQVGD